jgi:trk system potassium uptake protein TrkH
MKNRRLLILITLSISLAALILSRLTGTPAAGRTAGLLEYLVAALMAGEIVLSLRAAEYRKQYLIKNLTAVIFTAVFISLLIYQITGAGSSAPHYFDITIHIARNIFLLYRLVESIRSIKIIMEKISSKPAMSILTSFQIIIIFGTLLLMLPFATTGDESLSFIDAWFTATSAVCVTGLIVVDTATAFSLFGKIIILILIQIGGLGIMIISYFSVFIRGRRMSYNEKQRLSFAISDSDVSGITKTVKSIIFLTFSIEAAGALLLMAGFSINRGFSSGTVFRSLFHSISAFCNAGFSLFSNSLENFSGNPLIIFTISALIIAGGLSFAVIFNLHDLLTKKSPRKLSLNSKVVLSWTGILLIAGMFFFYAAEHRGTLMEYRTGTQYLAAFFQSVTLRTAGFNSVSFASFGTGTIVIMCLFMFIGAASGSTAGGIKINTAAVLTAYLKSIITGSPDITIYKYQLSQTRVLKAFVIMLYGIIVILLSAAVLSFTQQAELKDILFETVSAFGTVGLSTGLTGKLNITGKLIIIFLMFNGRLGPLTILSTLSVNNEKSGIRYPQGDIAIG